MATNAIVLKDIQDKLLPDFRQFKDFLRMVLPRSDEDRQLINLFVDMLSEMIEDMESAEELVDLKDWFKLRELTDDWDFIRKDLVTKYSPEVLKFMNNITDMYENGSDGGEL